MKGYKERNTDINSVIVLISHTSKSPSPTDSWRRFDQQEKCFDNMSQAKEWVKQAYYYCKKKVPIYQDTKQGTVKCGYIYCYKETEYNQKTGEYQTYYRQDWLSFYTVESFPIAV